MNNGFRCESDRPNQSYPYLKERHQELLPPPQQPPVLRLSTETVQIGTGLPPTTNAEPISYKKALSDMKSLCKVIDKIDEATSSKEIAHHKKQINIQVPHAWNQIVLGFEKEAGTQGLSSDDIYTVWKIVTSGDINLSINYRARLIFSMIPKEKVDISFTDETINWVAQHINGWLKDSKYVRVGALILQYLNGLLEYELVSENFANNFTFTTICSMVHCEALVGWSCRLLIRMATAKFIQRHFIRDLMSAVTRDVSTTSRFNVYEVLYYFKLLRPDLVPYDLGKRHPKLKGRKFDLAPTFRKRLYDASFRINNNPILTSGEQVKKEQEKEDQRKYFFPEFSPPSGDDTIFVASRLQQMSKSKIVKAALLDSSTLCVITANPEFIEVFNTWIYLIFLHKFGSKCKEGEIKCHEFMLKRCVELTILTQTCLSAVGEWLPKYLLKWDGCFLKSEIITLAAYLNPASVYGRIDFILEIIREDFLDEFRLNRFEVWDLLDSLAVRWLKHLSVESNQDINGKEEIHKSDKEQQSIVYTLMEFLHHLVCEYVTLSEDVSETLLIDICYTYYKLQKIIMMESFTVKLDFLIFPPVVLWHAVIYIDSLALLDSFFRYFNLLDEYMPLIRSKKSQQFKELKCFHNDVIRFFIGPDICGAEELFVAEAKFYFQGDLTDKDQVGIKKRDMEESRHTFEDEMTSMNAYNLRCLTLFLDTSSRDGLDANKMEFNKRKLKKYAPNLLQRLTYNSRIEME